MYSIFIGLLLASLSGVTNPAMTGKRDMPESSVRSESQKFLPWLLLLFFGSKRGIWDEQNR